MSNRPAQSTPTRPLLRWFGGKWRLAPWIISYMPAHRIYCEPFGGAGSVLLRKPRAYAEVINDLDDDLNNLFTMYRDRGDELIAKLNATPYSRAEFIRSYEPCDDAMEKARRLIVRSFMGFSSNSNYESKTGFRSDSNRSGTTPAHDWANYPDAMEAIIERLRGVVIEAMDAIHLIDSMDEKSPEDTLFYLDPPYVLGTRNNQKRYKHEYTDSDHLVLLERIKTMKSKVLISGYMDPLYDGHLKDWIRVEKKAYADGAAARTECLWMNYQPQASQARLFGRACGE